MGGGSTTASGPLPYGYEEDMKRGRRKEISENKDLDEESRKELLDTIDNGGPDGEIASKYQQALDPENPTTKDRKRRAAAKKIEEDSPGLRKQTFLGNTAGTPSGSGKTSYLGGGSR